MGLNIPRIDCASGDAMKRIAELRLRLSPDGDIVPAHGRELTKHVFGEALSPAQSVERICRDVRQQGFEAVRRYTKAFDRFELDRRNLRVSPAELSAAHKQMDRSLLETVRRVRRNIDAFQSGILHRDAMYRDRDLQVIRLRYRPVRRVGVCVPGGAAAYPSTLLMTVCPAQAAGVQEIAVIAPPTKFGSNNETVLAVCHELGVNEVYRVGGAQAVAAMAFGVDGLPRVDMLVGPGNLFVALAKKYVYGHVGIDMIAGPTEVVIVADESADPKFVAADLISQAEHAPGASILITWIPALVEAVTAALEPQLKQLPRGADARASLEQFGALILCRNAEEAVELANQIAPEHLQLCTKDADAMAECITNAGAIFLGSLTPVALGDYVAGPSHVLPTGGTARFASGLTANDFLRRSSVIKTSRAGLETKADDVRALAAVEGLTGHSASVDIRLNGEVRRPSKLKKAAVTSS